MEHKFTMNFDKFKTQNTNYDETNMFINVLNFF